MQMSVLLLKQIIQLFLMIFMGYVMVKINFLKEEDSKVISKIILYLIVPCVIVEAFQVDYTKSVMKGLMVAAAASVILQFLLFVCYMDLWEGLSFKYGRIYFCLLFKFWKFYCAFGYLYFRKRMGDLWLRIYECSAFLSLDAL